MNRKTRPAVLVLLTVLSALSACQKPPRSRGEALGQMSAVTGIWALR